METRCPNCKSKLEEVKVEVEDAKTKAISYQCPKCDFVTFDPVSSAQVIKELKTGESPLKIKQKIVKLSHERLGMYFNKDVIRSLNLESGKEILISVPDKKHIVLNIVK